jgi:glycosyltransferase involved in cell wall biosynthesis
MHICQIIDGLPNDGAQRLIVYFAQQGRLNNDQITTAYFSEENSSIVLKALTEAGCTTHFSAMRRLYNPLWSFELEKYLRSMKVDIVQSHLSYANILSAMAGRLAGIPVAATLHTSNFKNQYYRPVIFRAEMAMLRYFSSSVIAVANAVADVYRPYLGKKKPIIIPNPVTAIPRLAEAERNRIRDQYLPRLDALLMISVGRLTAPKGYRELIEAFHLTEKAFPDARLIIAGRGEEKDNLEKKISEYGLAGKITLLGERSDVPALLAASDLFLSASYWEGMPVSVLEAMAAGLPVIATRVGGVPEILEGRGVMAPPRQPEALAKEMTALMRNPERMRRLGLAGQQYVLDHHSPEKWYSNMISHFKTLMKK